MPLLLAQLPSSANVKGYWLLGEAGGASRVDSSGNSNTLGDTNTVTQQTGHEGGSDKAAGFTNGAGNYLAIADGSQTGLDLTGAFTVAGWVNPQTLRAGNNMSLISKGHEAASNANYYLWITDTGSSVFKMQGRVSNDGTTVTTVNGSGTFSNSTWYHVAMVYVPSTSLTLYINGVQDATNTTSIPASLFNGAANFELGRTTASATNFWDHYQDEWVVWNTNLSASQILQVYSESANAGGAFLINLL
jgi:hypothetical protein